MRHDLLKELIAEDNHVFKIRGGFTLIWCAAVLDLSLTEEIEPCAMNDFRLPCERVATEEDRSAKDPFKRSDQAPIFPSTLTHAENPQHSGRGFESDGLALLLHGECRQKNGDNPVLAKRHTVVGMAGDLEYKRTVLAFVNQLPGRQRPDRQAA
jgi:hypothetical protein